MHSLAIIWKYPSWVKKKSTRQNNQGFLIEMLFFIFSYKRICRLLEWNFLFIYQATSRTSSVLRQTSWSDLFTNFQQFAVSLCWWWWRGPAEGCLNSDGFRALQTLMFSVNGYRLLLRHLLQIRTSVFVCTAGESCKNGFWGQNTRPVPHILRVSINILRTNSPTVIYR